ncbi:neurotransmitter-gated ion-channel ligand binding domain-containing protein [Ditylenchus destructor]|nr:neurotransmitter-gated ion-channel ligand binding domain-containing protein [Ditylenchus destructor]
MAISAVSAVSAAKFSLPFFLGLTFLLKFSNGNEDAKRLYDDLLTNYNRHKRPADSPLEPITIRLKLRLSQIIDVHEIDQIMTCSVWVKQVWTDRKLKWDPEDYGGVSVLYVPYELIWIVLYNNADSHYNITISTKATLRHSGQVTWEPPAIFKSLCQIDVQCAILNLGLGAIPRICSISNSLAATLLPRFVRLLSERRMGHHVFYLPSDSGEKIALCISILVALTVFFLLLTEIIPATSITLPLIALNFHFRKPTTHKMGRWIKRVFLTWLPRLLFMRRPLDDSSESLRRAMSTKGSRIRTSADKGVLLNLNEHRLSRDLGRILASAPMDERLRKMYYSPTKKKDKDDKVDEDWKYVAMVLDRLFLIIFALVCFFGTAWILLQAPTFYDGRQPIDLQYRPTTQNDLPLSFEKIIVP